MNATSARMTLVPAIVVLLAGYAVVVRPLEATIAERYAAVADARILLEREGAIAARLPALEAERERLRSQLGRLHVRDSRAALLDRFLHHVARTAASDRVSVQAIASVSPIAPAAAVPSSGTTLEQESFDVTLRGTYGDVIRAVRDLNAGDLPLRIAIASLGRAGQRTGLRPQLNLTTHITLLREADESTPHPPQSS